MRTDLDHLPDYKRADLETVLRIIFDGFFTALQRAPSATMGQILKVILFGSHARGTWVDDPEGGYISDFDILVVVNDARFAEHVYWHNVETELLTAYIGRQLSAPTTLIVHSLADMQAQLARKRYFFVDVIRQGIALHDLPGHPLDEPAELPAAIARDEEQRYFKEWLQKADSLFRTASHTLRDGDLNLTAFLLHQTAERLYQCALLTLTLYTPKSHDLPTLNFRCGKLDPRLAFRWTESKFASDCYELLNRAYVEARYSLDYQITMDELGWLAGRIADLRTRVETVGRDHLARPFDPDAPYVPRGFHPGEHWPDDP